MWRFVAPAVLACSLHAGCIAVNETQLLARDLAEANTAFAALDPNLVFSYAPVLGKRIISAADLEKWAADHGLQNVRASSTCFERAMKNLEREDVMGALKAAIGSDVEDLRLEVTDICPCKVPAGRLQFPLSGASLPPSAHPEIPVLWRGHLVGADGTTYSVWARVRAIASVRAVRALSDLHSQQTLSRKDLEEIRIPASPLRSPQGVVSYEGKVMKVSLARGAVLQPEFVRTPSEVERGSLVTVEVVNGAARLALEARAETAGNTGQVVTLTNPVGAARFRASVTGPGRAQIVLSNQYGQNANSSTKTLPMAILTGRSF